MVSGVPCELFSSVTDGDWIMSICKIDHPRFNERLFFTGDFFLCPGTNFRHDFGNANCCPLLAVNKLAQVVLELRIAHHIRLSNQEDLVLQFAAEFHHSFKTGDEVIKMDEGLAMIAIAGKEVTLELFLVDAADVLSDGNGMTILIVNARDAENYRWYVSTFLPDKLLRLDLRAWIVPRFILEW